MSTPTAAALSCLIALTLASARPAAGAEKPGAKKPEPALSESVLSGLKLRQLGPALTSGRIADLAVDPTDSKVWWIAAAAGGVWKTTNAGSTFAPVFGEQGSWSIGALAIDAGNPDVVWVGTGENNNQRVVGYGDGVYRTLDGGVTWKRTGLEKSEHIGRILVDPRDSDVVWVAAQGPLWSSGGERGVYKTTDGGGTWKRVLHVDDDTGATDIVFAGGDPDTVIAAMHQRRRHVWTYVSGGPGSSIHKTTDGGATWRRLEKGLPEASKGDLGRVGLAVSPVDPGIVYAIVEAEEDLGGLFRSTDRGESWEKRSSHSTAGNYYTEIFADPKVVDRIYSMDTFLQVSDDGGKNFRRLGERNKHVDNHAMWIDPEDGDHYLVGCDGGLYESFDRGATWRFFENLPITQFYRVSVDDAKPFYNVCGGTQDNFSMCGPSGTTRHQGPANEDWFITKEGDGFWTVVDPENPDIIYAESQYGVLSRFDRRTGENHDIQPQAAAGELEPRWNWDSPLLLSRHAPGRLYFAANRIYRSDDRGQSWTPISGDLTRQIDRNKLKVFGKIQRPEAVARGASTSPYGNIVALSESPFRAGLLYAGTDDGLVQVTEDGGSVWRKVESFPGVPDRAYVRRLNASRHDEATVFAAFDNHKMGDFKPYLLKSTDRGRTWVSIAGDLPARGTAYSLVEDPVDRDLIFAGTEFGLFVTVDGGRRWVRLKGGLPTVQVRDLAIQEREDDLVLATFGLGFYVLDDISPLRSIDEASLAADSQVFDVPDARLFVRGSRIALRDNGFLGETYYNAPNEPYGASFTWYLKDGWESGKKARQKAEEEARDAGRDIEFPDFEKLRAEKREEKGRVVVTVLDGSSEVVRRLETDAEKGIHRLGWDLRFPPVEPASKSAPELDPWDLPPVGPLVAPGTYRARFELVTDQATTPLGEKSFEVVALGNASLPVGDRAAALGFQQKTARLYRAVLGASRYAAELGDRLSLLRLAYDAAPAADPGLDRRLRAAELALEEIRIRLTGDSFLRSKNEVTAPSISDRVQSVAGGWYSTAEPTATQREGYRIAGEAFAVELERLKALGEGEVAAIEAELEKAGAPWTPGRLPEWRLEP